MEFDFANPWYESEPLSTVHDFTLSFHGCPVAVGSQDLYFVLRGQEIPVPAARNLHELWWGFSEIAQIRIKGEAVQALEKAGAVDMEIHFHMRMTMNYGIPGNIARYVLSKRLEVA